MIKDNLQKEIEKCYEYKNELNDLISKHENIIILGNGGSSSIASHISQDYTKKLKKRAYTFSDASRLTCYANDYGYDLAYKQFLKEFIRPNEKTLVVLISSSGNSQNILNCASLCEQYDDVDLITLTGFSSDNKLKTMNIKNRKINFWVDSSDYGLVECAHMIFLHMVA
jgi:D-sedoheptulose 7-phosphate isomerase